MNYTADLITRLTAAAEPFVSFNSSEEFLELRVPTRAVNALRLAIHEAEVATKGVPELAAEVREWEFRRVGAPDSSWSLATGSVAAHPELYPEFEFRPLIACYQRDPRRSTQPTRAGPVEGATS